MIGFVKMSSYYTEIHRSLSFWVTPAVQAIIVIGVSTPSFTFVFNILVAVYPSIKGILQSIKISLYQQVQL